MKKYFKSLSTTIVFSTMYLMMVCICISPCNAADSTSEAENKEGWRINCGAETFDYTAPDNTWWMMDEAYDSLYRWGYVGDTSSAARTGEEIAGTDCDPIYQTNRWGDVGYAIEVPDGTYKVKLMFSENHFDSPGQRVFDVAIDGTTYWTNVDVYAWSGNAQYTAMDLVQTVTVNDGLLDVSFPVVYVDNPMVSGIEVTVVDVSDDAFLDFIQKKMFWFYINECDQTTGLVKWGENNWGAGNGVVSSMASNGFALSIYTVAASRGWMTEDEAYERTMRMLTTVENMLDDKEGFWYHYVNTQTGARADSSEISTVDSALFIMGALQAGEYFKDTHPDVLEKADLLYQNMNWQWFTNVNNGDPWQNQFVNMGWKPENDGYSYIIPGEGKGGYFCSNWWNSYSETIFVDLLAIASPTFPVGVDAWNNMHHPWVYDHGYNYINCPPLFTHQYQSLYYDFRDIKFYGIDLFLNSEKATLANRNTCVRYTELYEEDVWGLTACGTPDDSYYAYGAEPGGGHDGTVAPTAAITSIMFTERESLRAARKMFFAYKQKIWGLHGFCDSFNFSPTYDFRNWSGNALDNGAMILGIENYRTGMVLKTFMQNEHVRRGLERAGFVAAEGIEISASSEEGDSSRAYHAYDGNAATRWASMQSAPGIWEDTPQWLEIDFKEQRDISGVTINWEAAYASMYCVQVSDDRMKWTDVYNTDAGDGDIDEIVFSPMSARYLRVYMTGRGTEWGYSIWDISVTFSAVSAPSEIVVEDVATSGSLQLSWTEPTESGFDHVRIYRSMVEGDLGELIQDDMYDTSLIDTGLVNGETYYYTFRSVTAQGIESSNVDQYSGIPSYSPPVAMLQCSSSTLNVRESFSVNVTGESPIGLSVVTLIVVNKDDPSALNIPGAINGVDHDLSVPYSFPVVVGEHFYEDSVNIEINNPGNYSIKCIVQDMLFPVDGEVHEWSHSCDITVLSDNTMPYFRRSASDYSTRVGKRLSFSVIAFDNEGDDISLEVLGGPDNATFYAGETRAYFNGTSICRGWFSYVPEERGECVVQFRAVDSHGAVVLSEPVTISVKEQQSQRNAWYYWLWYLCNRFYRR